MVNPPALVFWQPSRTRNLTCGVFVSSRPLMLGSLPGRRRRRGGRRIMTEALVTGASGGIGTAICQSLALRGVKVTLHYRSDRQAAEATRRTLAGEDHRLIQADISDPTSIERLWKEACAGPPIDVVVNNAGIFPAHPPLTTRYADWLTAWQRTLAT